MSQAENRNTTTLSRRSALAGLSLLAAASAAPIAAGAAPELGDDAELLALAAQFEPLYAEWLGLMVIQETHRVKFDALLAPMMQARLGDAYTTRTPDESWDERHQEARASAVDEINRDNLYDYEDLPWEDFHDRFYPVFDEIFSYLATTREGLALQVRALLCRDLDFNDDDHMRTLVEGVCLVVGVQFPQFEVTESQVASS